MNPAGRTKASVGPEGRTERYDKPDYRVQSGLGTSDIRPDMSDKAPIELSILVPLYNEQENIPLLYTRLGEAVSALALSGNLRNPTLAARCRTIYCRPIRRCPERARSSVG